jgi:hypothetical protein
MAGGAIIGALRVVLGADTAALDTGLKSSQSKLGTFGKSVAMAGAAAAAAFVAAGVATAAAIKGAIDEADNLSKAAQKWGVPIEELTRLKHAADLSGVSFEGLGTGLSRLARGMSETAGGAVNTTSRAFDALGISVKNTDGTLKSSQQVMTEVAGKFGGMEDGAGKTALAMAIFGKSGAELIPMLNGGAEGLKAMTDEADELGLVIDSKTARAAEAFNDNLTRLGKVKDGIIMQVTARMLPALEGLSKAMFDGAKNSQLLDTVSQALAGTLRVLVSAGVIVGAVFKTVFENVGVVARAVMQVAKGEFSAALETMKGGFSNIVENTKGAATTLATIWDEAAAQNEAKAPDLANKIAAPVIQSAEKATQAMASLDQFFLSQLKQQTNAAAQIESMDLTTGAYERMRVTMQALAIVEEKKIPLTEALKQKIANVGLAAEQTALKLKGKQLVLANRTPHEAYQLEMENNRLAIEALGLSAEDSARIMERTAERYGTTWHQAGESIAGSIADIGNAFGKENKAMAMVAKVAGIIQATISMFVGGAKALELPFPANIAAVAAVIAKGAALVAQVRGVSTGGFKTGGSFRVGGAGGADSQQVTMDVSPGEQVDIWRPGEQGGDPRGRGRGNGPVDLSGVVPLDDWIAMKGRDLVRIINDAIGDGGRLRTA